MAQQLKCFCKKRAQVIIDHFTLALSKEEKIKLIRASNVRTHKDITVMMSTAKKSPFKTRKCWETESLKRFHEELQSSQVKRVPPKIPLIHLLCES